MTQFRGAIFDIDGTLVDSNDAHAHAWVEAMAEQGYNVPFERVRPLIGMGGDKVLPETLNIDKNSEQGQRISRCRKEIFFTRYLPGIQPFPQVHPLLEMMHAKGLKLVIATSAEPDELKGLLERIGPHVADLFSRETTSEDAKHSKPDPDVMDVALERMGYPPQEVVMLGDTAYDIEAAAQVHVDTIALRCGGWKDQDLRGAIAIYDDPADLFAHYQTSPLANTSEPHMSS